MWSEGVFSLVIYIYDAMLVWLSRLIYSFHYLYTFTLVHIYRGGLKHKKPHTLTGDPICLQCDVIHII